MKSYSGGCHCGRVIFEVDLPDRIDGEACNCSICVKSGYLHMIVSQRQFRLLRGEKDLTTYTFNKRVAKHRFCSHCGIKSFYIPRSNPDGVDININCLDTPPADIKIHQFDGQNWEQNAHTLAHKSQ